jgi:hypothetical protein
MIKPLDSTSTHAQQIDYSACCSRSCRTSHGPCRSAAPCAFSLTTRITQRDGRQGTDAPGSRTHVPGPGRQPEPGRWMSPGWRPSPRSPAVSGHPADSPAVPESVLEPRRHQGIPAGAPAHPCAVTRSQLHRRSDGPVRCARRTRMPAPRQSRKTLSAHGPRARFSR